MNNEAKRYISEEELLMCVDCREKEGRRKYALLFIEVSWYFVDDRKSTCPWDNERIRQVVKPVDGRWIGIICSYKRRRWWYWLKNDWSDWKRDCSFEEDDRMER